MPPDHWEQPEVLESADPGEKWDLTDHGEQLDLEAMPDPKGRWESQERPGRSARRETRATQATAADQACPDLRVHLVSLAVWVHVETQEPEAQTDHADRLDLMGSQDQRVQLDHREQGGHRERSATGDTKETWAPLVCLVPRVSPTMATS